MKRSSDRRYARLKQGRTEIAALEKRRCVKAAEDLRTTGVVWPEELNLLIEATKEGPLTPGRPDLLSGFHKWIAITYWWHRRKHEQEKDENANRLTREQWQIAESTVTKYSLLYKDAAKPAVDAFIADNSPPAVTANIQMFVDAYHALGV